MIGKNRFCKICGKNGVLKGRRFHWKCRPYNKLVTIKCFQCRWERRAYERNGRALPVLCSSCYHKKLKERWTGEGSPTWKGGIKPLNKIIRDSKEYAAWRIAVFQRDNYTCVWCGKVGGQLNADHIRPFAYFPSLRLKLSNGRTLCVPCHKRTDTFLGKALKNH